MSAETRLLTPDEAAEWLTVCRRTLQKLPIRKVRIGQRRIAYDVRDLQAYADLNGTRNPMLRKVG